MTSNSRTTPLSPPPAPTVPDSGRANYLPDAAKLVAAGFRLSKCYSEATSFVCNMGAEERVIIVYHVRGKVKLKDEDCQRMEYACPSEAFFDQLLIAVGWQPQP